MTGLVMSLDFVLLVLRGLPWSSGNSNNLVFRLLSQASCHVLISILFLVLICR